MSTGRVATASELLRAARGGAWVGIAAHGALNFFRGSLASLVGSIFSLLVPLFAAGGALLGAFVEFSSSLGRTRKRFLWNVGTSSLAALHVLLFASWVPSGWIFEHWSDLSSSHRALAASVLAAIFVSVCAIASFFAWIGRRWAERRLHPAFLVAGSVLSLLGAGACYWADAVVYEGDYEDFHYGLAGAFVGLVALLVIQVRALLSRR
jgi:hypothetical protein